MSIFSKVKRAKVRTSNFNLSEEHKLSCNFGELIPILCKEVIPNDKFDISTELLIKFAPLKAPVMHRIQAKVDYFFVPNFQLTDIFQDFINPKVNTASSPVVLPYTTTGIISGYGRRNSSLISTLSDYLGLPVTQTSLWSASGYKVSVLPYMAYQHIYNSFFRDQNMEVLEGAVPTTTSLYLVDTYRKTNQFTDSVVVTNQLTNLFKLRTSAWKKDYFTSALPSPQAGDDVTIPFTGGNADVYLKDDLGQNDYQSLVDNTGTGLSNTNYLGNDETADLNFGSIANNNAFSPMGNAFLDPNGTMYADMSNVNALSVNNLRKLFALQRFKELAERGGTRYPEMVRNFFGAFLPDWYFDRPIYLGGQVQPVSIGEVVQNVSDSTNPLAYRGGIANSYGKTRTVHFKSPCHGFIMGILRILPEATYSQGIERMWTRESLYDFAFPQFANLGEQEILNREIFADGSSADTQIFGYTPRYSEYKTGHCHIAGKFRSDLDYWHFGRTFSNRPLLNKAFINMDSMDYDPFYVTADTTEHVYVDLYNNIFARRPLPYFGTPGSL